MCNKINNNVEDQLHRGFLSRTLFIKFVFSVSGYVQDLLLYVESQLHRINPDSDGHCD